MEYRCEESYRETTDFMSSLDVETDMGRLDEFMSILAMSIYQLENSSIVTLTVIQGSKINLLTL